MHAEVVIRKFDVPHEAELAACYLRQHGILARVDSPITSVTTTADMAGQRIAVQRGSVYEDWVKITQGKVEQPGEQIRSRFGSEYVITDLQHTAFLKQAGNDSSLKEVFRDKYAVVLEVGR